MNKIPKKILFSLPKFSDLRGSLSLLRCNTIKKGTKNVPDFFTKNPDQIFISETKPWHGRGLHYQMKNPLLQTVTVVSGEIEECLVEKIETTQGIGFKTYKDKITSHDEFNSFVIPKGWAHGFFTKDDAATILYQIWGLRSIDDELGFNLRDSRFGFLDKIERSKIKLNERDNAYKLLD
jgi:dTDP-4-dehydrorhamnose 3,5-epimerase-like enzyme